MHAQTYAQNKHNFASRRLSPSLLPLLASRVTRVLSVSLEKTTSLFSSSVTRSAFGMETRLRWTNGSTGSIPWSPDTATFILFCLKLIVKQVILTHVNHPSHHSQGFWNFLGWVRLAETCAFFLGLFWRDLHTQASTYPRVEVGPVATRWSLHEQHSTNVLLLLVLQYSLSIYDPRP